MKRLFPTLAVLLTAAALLCGCNLGQNTPPPPTPSDGYAQHADAEGSTLKKGVCVSRYGNDTGAEQINSLGVSWYYNWAANVPTDKIDAEYVPMVWGAGSVNETTLSRIREGVKNGTYTHVLTFNEPDADTPGISSGISVERALDLWPQLEALDVPLSSPAPTYYGTGWLDAFMEGALARGYRVDFIALHCYQDFSDPKALDALKAELTTVYEKYRLPIWITEFGAIDIWTWGGGKNPACTESAALDYTKKVTDMLENLGFVERYAWFIDNTGSPAEVRDDGAKYTYLFDNDGALSSTGEIYRAQVSGHPLSITDTDISMGEVGHDYFYPLSAQGGKGDYRFSVEGELPDGILLGSSGELCGRPTEDGAFPVRIFAEDEGGQVTFSDFILVIVT